MVASEVRKGFVSLGQHMFYLNLGSGGGCICSWFFLVNRGGRCRSACHPTGVSMYRCIDVLVY